MRDYWLGSINRKMPDPYKTLRMRLWRRSLQGLDVIIYAGCVGFHWIAPLAMNHKPQRLRCRAPQFRDHPTLSHRPHFALAHAHERLEHRVF